MQQDLRQDKHLIGASDNIYNLVNNLINGRHTLLIGDRGVGKSRLMEEVKGVLSGEIKNIDFSFTSVSRLRKQVSMRIKPDKYKIIFIENAYPLSVCFKEVCKKLYDARLLHIEQAETDKTDIYAMTFPEVRKKYLKQTDGNINIQKIIFSSLKHNTAQAIIFFIDNLDRITPTYQVFFETLLMQCTVCTATSKIKDNLSMKKIWSSFAHFELKPLNNFNSSLLIEYFLSNYPIHILDRDGFKKEILRSSNGNPFYIKNFLWHGSCQKYTDKNIIWELRDTDENKFLNLGPIYVFILIFSTVIKIFSIGLYAREFYIYASAIGFIGYVIFRVFRSFFLFKPQRSLVRRQNTS